MFRDPVPYDVRRKIYRYRGDVGQESRGYYRYAAPLVVAGSGILAGGIKKYISNVKEMPYKTSKYTGSRYNKRVTKGVKFTKQAPMSRQTRTNVKSQLVNGRTVYSRSTKGRMPYKRATSLSKTVRLLKKSVESDQARHTYKELSFSKLGANVAQCNHNYYTVSSTTKCETFMSQLRYYDPSVPGTLVTADASTGTYSRLIHFNNISSRIILRNNYQVPCKVRIYLVKPKSDTNIAPTTYYNNGITDQVISGGSLVTPAIYLSDIQVFTKQFSIKLLKDVVLDVGSQVEASHSTGPFEYDPSLVDSHSVVFQPKYKSAMFMVRIEGVSAHDTSASEYSTTEVGVDICHVNVAKISYDAGVNLNDIYVSDNRASSFTNAGVVSNKPIADNQSYSVS